MHEPFLEVSQGYILSISDRGATYLFEVHEPFLEVSQVLLSRQQLCRGDPHPLLAVVIIVAASTALVPVGRHIGLTTTFALGVDSGATR